MVGWHHQLDGHGFGWTPAVGDGQGGLECCSPWGCKESDTPEQLNKNSCCGAQALGCVGFCSCGSQALEHRLSFPTACGIFLNLEWNLCPLQSHADS